MMKNFLCFLFFAISSSFLFGQNIIRVNNMDGANADYTNLQEAIDTAVSGAIIYLYPSGVNYGDAIIENKQVAIIGAGFKVAANVDPDANTSIGSTFVGYIQFKAGTNNSSISGCEFTKTLSITNASGIQIYRNYFNSSLLLTNCTNVHIINNFSNPSFKPLILSGSTGIYIEGNVFLGSSTNFSDYHNIYAINNSSAIIKNNIFRDYVNVYNSTITNNIFITSVGTARGGVGNTIINNLFENDIAAFSSDNLTGVDISSIFVGYPDIGTYSFDKRFQLKENSLAKGYGTGGRDCGIFGGDSPYIPSGVPNIPVIYQLNAPNSVGAGSTLNVTVKAKSGN